MAAQDPKGWTPGPQGFPGAAQPAGFPGPPAQQAWNAPGAPSWHGPPAYRDAKGMANAILVLLAVYLLIALVTAFTSTTTVQSSDSGVQVWKRAEGPLGFLGLALFVAMAILTPLWLARVHRNAEALSGQPLKGSPGWTAGCWFIPIVGGFLAAAPLGRIWERGPGGSKLRPLAWAILFSVWQCILILLLFVVVGIVAGEVAARGGQPSAAESEEISLMAAEQIAPFDLVTSVLQLASGVFMGLTILALQAWQSKAAQAGPAAQGSRPWT